MLYDKCCKRISCEILEILYTLTLYYMNENVQGADKDVPV